MRSTGIHLEWSGELIKATNLKWNEQLNDCRFVVRIYRMLWTCLIVLSIICSTVICIDQFMRYWKGPIVVSLESDYRNWAYRPPAITYCQSRFDYRVVDRIAGSYCNASAEDCAAYKALIRTVANSNVSNLHTFERFEHLSAKFTGDDLLEMAAAVFRSVFEL